MSPKGERLSVHNESELSASERKELFTWAKEQAEKHYASLIFISDEHDVVKEAGSRYIPGLVLCQLALNPVIEVSQAGYSHIERQLAVEHEALVPQTKNLPTGLRGAFELLRTIKELAGSQIEEYQNLGVVTQRKGPLEWRQAISDLNKLHKIEQR